MKKVLALVLALVMALALVACGGNDSKTPADDGSKTPSTDNQTPSTPSNDSSAASGRVYWLNFKPESDEVLQNVGKLYTEKTGVPVKVVTAASGTYSQTLNAEMGKSEAPTIFVVGNQAGVRDWTDYALDLKGTAIEAELGFDAFTSCDMDGSSNWRFVGHMANLEYYYEQEGTPWTECPPTLTGKYMDNFKNLYDLCINNSLTAPTDLSVGGHDASEEFRSGKAAFQVQGSWEYDGMKEQVPNATMIPYYCGVAGEEKAGLNCGTENCWAINAKVSAEDQQATMDFMVWCVTDPEASRMLVDTFGVMPYKNAAESTNAFLADANEYSNNGCYVMNWATNFQPNVDEYRAALTSALNAYNADQSDANWEGVRTAFVDGWAAQYQVVNG